MDINGIWKVELLGVYDWEPVATAFLKDGQYLSGGNDSYTVGKYKVDGNQVIIDVKISNYKMTRVMFGKKSSKFDVRFQGTLEGDVIEGEAREGLRHLMRFKVTKVAELP